MRKGFTLIELLVVIAIIAILAVVVVLTLNPAELLRQSRDSNRVSDMSTLNSAINLYTTDQSGASSFSLGSSSVVYVSIPDPSATSTVGDQCQGLGLISLPSTYMYHCAASSTFKSINGSGWIPVNLTNLSSGSPISNLPADPINQSSSRLYYTYTTNGSQFEVTAPMESQKYQLGGSNDQISGDGGPLATVYEKGSQLGLEPLDYGDSSLVGLWTMDEGTGTTAYDWSGNGNNGTLSSPAPTWTTGKVGNGALNFNGSNNSVSTGANNIPLGSNPRSVFAWVYLPSVGGDYIIQSYGTYSGSEYSALWAYGGDVYYGDGAEGFVGPSGITSNTWCFVGYTYNGGTSATVYINGQPTTGNFSSPMNTVLGSVAIGLGYNPSHDFSGLIDDVRIYNRSLSTTQVQAMYNGGK
jgi:prepilin-type N-terminal cleavage/methylation domain-containing protein